MGAARHTFVVEPVTAVQAMGAVLAQRWIVSNIEEPGQDPGADLVRERIASRSRRPLEA